MSWSDDVSRLQEQTERGRLDLLLTDLDLIRTLASLVDSELRSNNHEHAVQTLDRANKGYVDMCRIFERRNSWAAGASSEIMEKLAKLRQELDRLQQLVHPSP